MLLGDAGVRNDAGVATGGIRFPIAAGETASRSTELDGPTSAKRRPYCVIRYTTWYFATSERRPGVSPAGIAFRISSPAL